MKRFAFFFGILALAAAGCSQENDRASEIKLISDATQVVAADGGNIPVTFSTDGEWEAHVSNVSGYAWSAINPTRGGAGDNTVTVTALPNRTHDPREMSFTITAGSVRQEVHLVQIGQDGFYVVTKSFSVPSGGGSYEIEVMTNVGYTYTISDPDWISSAPSSKSLENKTIGFTVAENRTFEARRGAITVKGDTGLEETVTVTQEEFVPLFEVSETAFTFGPGGGSAVFSVRCDIDHTVELAEVEAGATLTAADGSYTLTVPENEDYADHVYHINITTAHPDYRAEVTVTVRGLAEFPWSRPLLDLDGLDVSDNFRLAYSGGRLIVWDGSVLHILDAATGEKTGSADNPALPDGYGVADLTSDAEGHIVLLGSKETGEEQISYRVFYAESIEDLTPVALTAEMDWEAVEANYVGNIRVSGNVKSEAAVTAVTPGFGDWLADSDYPPEASPYYIGWQVSGGAAASPLIGRTPMLHDRVWWMSSACVAAPSDNLSGGLYFVAYAPWAETDKYELLYTADAAAPVWSAVYSGLATYRENLNALSFADFGGSRYCAAARGYMLPKREDRPADKGAGVYVLNVDNPAVPVLFHEISQDLVTGGTPREYEDNQCGDVLVTADESHMTVFYLDGLFNTVACIRYNAR